jgi:peptidoglycan/xylan/chitin deacetylase (PgdA/CDA1 family)
MRLLAASALVAAAIQGASAACASSSLVVDDFSKYSTHVNNLGTGSYTSDDKSMTSVSAAGGVLSITPKSGGYFYESFTCQSASSKGYNALQFNIKGPAGGAFSLELQTRTSCSATKYTSKYYTYTGLTGNTQTVTIPWTSWSGVNADAIVGIVWYGFSSNSAGWQLSNVQFVPGSACASSSNSASSSVVVSSSIVVSSSRASSFSTFVSSSRASSSSLSGASSIPSAGASSSSSLIGSSSFSSIVSSIGASSSSLSAPISSSSGSVSSSFPGSRSSSGRSSSSGFSTVSSSSASVSASPSGACSSQLIEDFTSQSRMTFLYYNAMLLPTSDDATMKSVVVDQINHRGTFTPTSASSYWYTQLGCFNAAGKYDGISLRIKAPAGTSFTVELGYQSSCGNAAQTNIDVTTKALGWTFDGTEKLYSFKFSQFAGLDASKLSTLLFYGTKQTFTLGPISMYCSGSVSEYVVPASSTVAAPSSTVAAPSGTAAAFVLDNFSNKNTNTQGFWHGGDDDLTLTWGTKQVKIVSSDPDYAFYSQFSASCKDLTSYQGSYLHIKYSGSLQFSIALQQHNPTCNESVAPFPETWDEVEASRYGSNGDIYVPISHFNIVKTRVIGVALKSWFTTAATTISLIEIVPSVPAGWQVESKLPTGQLVFACKRPNSFAFCIDDGDPHLAQQVMEIIKAENIKVTFFTVGAPLLDPSSNLSNVYQEMRAQGHQIALHSYTHPKMEGLPDYNAIDWEYNNDVSVVAQTFQGLHTNYFRPPFGTEGARSRYRWTQAAGDDNAYIVNWSVDVQDWLWAMTDTPEKQLTSFKNDVDKGGNLVVMHYLYPSTVSYLQQFIQYAKASGKQLMRLDQCMMDPNAPPL